MITRYQIFLLVTLVLWPLVLMGILFLMGRIESHLARSDASEPTEAGLEPVSGETEDREVKIVFGDQVIGEGD